MVRRTRIINSMSETLISLREFSGEDNKSLYTDEVEQQKQAKENADRMRRAAIPGLLNPVTEINDDDL